MSTTEAPTTTSPVLLAGRPVGDGRPPYVIAEAGVNHDGRPDEALRLVDVAAAAGADAVKFQVFRAESLVAGDAPLAEYQRGQGAATQAELLRRLELDDAALLRVAAHARAAGLHLLATPFGVADVARVVRLSPPALKIASTDLNNLPLLRTAVESGLPLLVSTGAATRDEIAAAISRFDAWRVCGRLVLLHCVSCYPAPLERANLRAIRALRRIAGVPCGFSDHTRSPQSGAWAVAAGACVLEKHFTRDRSAAGPDHAMSLDPAGLREYVLRAREAHAALGDGVLGAQDIEADVRAVARRSVVAARDLPAGAALTADAITVQRPAGGIAADRLDELLGRRLAAPVTRGERITWEMLA